MAWPCVATKATAETVAFVATPKEPARRDAVYHAFKEAAAGKLKGLLAYSEAPLVSTDFRGDAHSAIVDGLSTMMQGGHFVKVVAWYDNEWGYALVAWQISRTL
jgi:glyceraldehyde 3-phosphate dehydrogenase (phosphorylating)